MLAAQSLLAQLNACRSKASGRPQQHSVTCILWSTSKGFFGMASCCWRCRILHNGVRQPKLQAVNISIVIIKLSFITGLQFAGMLTGSESPSYLLLRGEKGKAEASAKALWGEHYSQELYGTGSTPTDLESGVELSCNAALPTMGCRVP